MKILEAPILETKVFLNVSKIVSKNLHKELNDTLLKKMQSILSNDECPIEGNSLFIKLILSCKIIGLLFYFTWKIIFT